MTQENKKADAVSRGASPLPESTYWATLIVGLKHSSKEFYQRVKEVVTEHEVPDMTVKHIALKEGGMLSARREYLRFQRERFVIDVCGAPFGTSFFVSVRSGELPWRIWFLLALVIAFLCVSFFEIFFGRYGDISYSIARALDVKRATVITVWIWTAIAVVLATIIYIGPRLDQALVRLPVLGYFYARYLRTVTYYRVDRQVMYRTAVEKAVKEVIDELTKAQGIAPMSEFERRPVMHELVGK